MSGSAASNGAQNLNSGAPSGSAAAGKRPARPSTAHVDRAIVFPAGVVLRQLPCFRDQPGVAGGSTEINLDYVLSAEGQPMSRFGCEYAIPEFLHMFMRMHAPTDGYAFQELAGQVKHGATGSATFKVQAAQRSVVRSALTVSLPLLRQLDERVVLPGPPQVGDAALAQPFEVLLAFHSNLAPRIVDPL